MNTVVVAGAGAGKTYALVQAYLKALFGFNKKRQRILPSQILAVTFTEKAAAEMRTRIVSQLLSLARSLDFEDWMIEESKIWQVALPEPVELKRMGQGLLSAPICTFHSFCSKIIREYGQSASLDTEFELLEPLNELDVELKVAQEVVIGALIENIEGVESLVTRLQLKKLGDAKGLCENLVNAYHQMLEHDAVPNPKAFAPVYEKANEQYLGLKGFIEAINHSMSNFQHAISSPKTAEKLVKIENALTVLWQAVHSPKEREVKISKAFSNLRALVKGRFGNDTLRKDLVQNIVSFGSHVCGYYTRAEESALLYLVGKLHESVVKYKHDNGVLGFGDLLLNAKNMLRKHAEIRRKVKAGLSKVLVDEFQDTSPLQEELVALLCEKRGSELVLCEQDKAMERITLEEDILFIVGDPKQSIYGFRGADVSLFNHTLLKVTRDPKVGIKRALTVCRRSQGAVVELVNMVGLSTLANPESGIYFDKEDQLSALKPAEKQAGQVWTAKLAPDFDRQTEIANAIAFKIEQMTRDEVIAYSDIVILVRRIKTAKPLLASLKSFGIPGQIYGGDGFYERQEVMDILAALRLLVNKQDELAAITVLRSPLVALADSDLIAVLAENPDFRGKLQFESFVNFANKSKVANDVKVRLNKFNDTIKSLRHRLGADTVGQIIECIINESDYVLSLAVEDDGDERLANIFKLKAMCQTTVRKAKRLINQLWKRLDEPPKESVALSLESKAEAVRIMTIHQSKGLEFDHVILADVFSVDPSETADIAFHKEIGLGLSGKGRPISVCAPQTSDEKQYAPTKLDRIRQKKRQDSKAELARLLYVALTRAKKAVYFTNAVEGEKEIPNRGESLRKLFFSGKEQGRKRFNELVPEEIIDTSALFLQKEISLKNDKEPAYYYELPTGPERVLASNVYPVNSTESGDKPTNELSVSRDEGIASHHVLSTVGSYLCGMHQKGHLISKDELRVLIIGVLNSSRFKFGSNTINLIVEKCSSTLLGPLRLLLDEGFNLNFEIPVYNRGEKIVVEGFADLVAHNQDQMLVIDFKSSYYTAKSKKTERQLLTYCEVLSNKFTGDLSYASLVIGEKSYALHKEFSA